MSFSRKVNERNSSEHRELQKFSDLIGKGGVGGILEIGGEAFIVAPTTFWLGQRVSGSYADYSNAVEHERLANAVNARRFKGPPNAVGYGTDKDPRTFPALVRFPKWAWCMHDACRRLSKTTSGSERMECLEQVHSRDRRRPQLVQMRWVGACTVGHVFDVPWRLWVNSGASKSQTHNPACTHERLRFYTARKQGVSGYGNDIVACVDCGRENSMQSIQEKDNLAALGLDKCPGTQPWAEKEIQNCKGQVEILMRSASRLHFSSSLEMIEIPPWSDKKPDYSIRARLQSVGLNSTQARLISRDPDSKSGDISYFVDELLKAGDSVSVDEVKKEILCWGHELQEESQPALAQQKVAAKSLAEELKEEWEALGDSTRVAPEQTSFVTRIRYTRSDLASQQSEIDLLGIKKIVEVKKLKSVRTYRGYRRLKVNGTWRSAEDKEYIDGRAPESDWLPAVELYGEGVFVDFDRSSIQKWLQSNPDNQVRIRALLGKLSDQHWIDKENLETMSSQAFPLLHSISHALIRELEFQSGYSAASIRERIYSDEQMSAILLYTGGSSSSGSLGGLASQSDPRLFLRLFRSAITRLVTCGQDPVCRESPGQGLRGLNLAACHACSLLPDTSCSHQNLVLDRLLVAQGNRNSPGFCEAGVLDAI